MTGATLVAAKDDGLFNPPERVVFPDAQGDECAIFHHALLAGDDIDDITISGGGNLDDERRRRKGPRPIALKNSSRVTIKDITSHNSPNYAVSLGNCEDILIENVRNTRIFACSVTRCPRGPSLPGTPWTCGSPTWNVS